MDSDRTTLVTDCHDAPLTRTCSARRIGVVRAPKMHGVCEMNELLVEKNVKCPSGWNCGVASKC